MKNFDLSEDMIAECNACCSESTQPEIIKSHKAELIICRWKLGHFPQIKNFIDNKSKSFKNLEIKYERGSPPLLKLYEASDSEGNEVAIKSWDLEAISEYLDVHLEN